MFNDIVEVIARFNAQMTLLAYNGQQLEVQKNKAKPPLEFRLYNQPRFEYNKPMQRR